jgi:hypothetical protein
MSFAFPTLKFIHHLATFYRLQTPKELTTVFQKEKGINFVIHFDQKYMHWGRRTVYRENQKFSLCHICISIFDGVRFM